MGPRTPYLVSRLAGEGRLKEAQVLRAVLDYLAVNDIWAMRCNTGAVKLENRFFRFGCPGMADVLAFKEIVRIDGYKVWRDGFIPVWIECKTDKGKQSELQKSFEEDVLRRGHRYFVVRSIEDLQISLDSIG